MFDYYFAPNIEEASSILGSICCNAEIPDLTPTGRLLDYKGHYNYKCSTC